MKLSKQIKVSIDFYDDRLLYEVRRRLNAAIDYIEQENFLAASEELGEALLDHATFHGGDDLNTVLADFYKASLDLNDGVED